MRIKSRRVLFALIILFCGLLAHIAKIMRTEPAQVAASQSAWTVAVSHIRGTIYDCHLQPMTNQQRQHQALVLPGGRLEPLYDYLSPSEYAKARDLLAQGQPAIVTLPDVVPYSKDTIHYYTHRRYAEDSLASHVIGYLDNSRQHGITGIEQSCDELLCRYTGEKTITYYTDGRGVRLPGVDVKVADTTDRSKGGVILTIDKQIQALVEDTASHSLLKGTVIVMDPYTGDIKALASFPSYHPDRVGESIQNDDGSLVNRALSRYDCGSVFKIVTTAAALEAGISAEERFTCHGYVDVDGVRIHCHNRLGHGSLTMSDALSQSCNAYFIQLAQMMGGAPLHRTAMRFGFDQSISTDGIQSATPLFPDESILNTSPIDLANLSFGQGYLMTSPLHIAQITSAIVNHGVLPTPRLIQGYYHDEQVTINAEDSTKRSVLSSQTALILREMLCQAVSDGTGRGAKPENGTVAGKTGTAETGQTGGQNPVEHSWFTGYLPAEDPQYVITVLAEDALNTNGQASKTFCEISNNLFKMMTIGE